MNKWHERETRKARLESDGLALAQGEPPAYSMTEIIELLTRQNEQALRSMDMIARVLAAPKKVTTPEGRVYTTEPALVN